MKRISIFLFIYFYLLKKRFMKNSQDPLLDIAMMYTQEISPRLSDEEKKSIRDLFSQYINGNVDFHFCSQYIKEKTGSMAPVERIREILEVPNEPLPTKETIDDSGLRKKTQQWSKAEDTRLIAGLHKYGSDNWSLVASFVGNNRTRSQCSQRWFRGLDPRISRQHWSKEEEKKLLELIEIYGDKSWIKVASELGNRSDVQCRYHYLQLQKESKKESNFDSSESKSSSNSISDINGSLSLLSKDSANSEHNDIQSLGNSYSQTPGNINYSLQSSYESSPNQSPNPIHISEISISGIQQNKQQQSQQFISQLPKVQVCLNSNLPSITRNDSNLLSSTGNSLNQYFNTTKSLTENVLTKTVSAQNNADDISIGIEESLPLNIEFFTLSDQASLLYESLWPMYDF